MCRNEKGCMLARAIETEISIAHNVTVCMEQAIPQQQLHDVNLEINITSIVSHHISRIFSKSQSPPFVPNAQGNPTCANLHHNLRAVICAVYRFPSIVFPYAFSQAIVHSNFILRMCPCVLSDRVRISFKFASPALHRSAI